MKAIQSNANAVPDGWYYSRFKDFAVLQRGKDLTDSNVTPGKYPVVKSNGVDIYHNEYFVEPPGVVTGRSGTIGNAFFVETQFWAHNTSLYVKNFKGNDPKFIYYLIKRMDFRRYFAGTTVPTLNRNDIHALKVSIPATQTEQKAIAGILSKVDEAIEAVEKSIKAAERLKKSLMQNLLTGKLKPDGTWRSEDEFYVDEKFGKVPKGWAFSRFKDFAVLQRGKDLTDNNVIAGPYPVVKSNGVQIYHHAYFVEPPGVVTGRSGTIGKAFFITEKFWAHNTTLYVKDFKGNCEKYIYYLILRMDFRQYYAGTTVPTLNRNDIHRLKIAIPKTFEEQECIVKMIDDSDNLLIQKRDKIQTLKTLKKSLMQHLLTGKVRVDVEKINKLLEEV